LFRGGRDSVTDPNCNRDAYCYTYWNSGSHRDQHADGDSYRNVNRHSYRNANRNTYYYARTCWQRFDPLASWDR
jgi:hypothetical protein